MSHRSKVSSASFDAASPAVVGVVVIGRNEGERLARCLDSVKGVAQLVYVDSGSSDGSVAMALNKGFDVLALDMTTPFTAARARNAGFQRLLELAPHVHFVQFIDGDCELTNEWLVEAVRFLREHKDVACVCGRLRERFPEQSIYQRLCDFEWNRAPGETDACGGIAMMRVDKFVEVGGFQPDLIAGEEPELCLRIRATGARIWRIANAMAWHDSAMLRFGQWWRRAMRGGYVCAEGAANYGSHPLAKYRKNLRKILMWGILFPIGIVLLAYFSLAALTLFLVYPFQIFRLARQYDKNSSRAWLIATFTVLAKFPECQGVLMYWLGRLRKSQTKIIEYK